MIEQSMDVQHRKIVNEQSDHVNRQLQIKKKKFKSSVTLTGLYYFFKKKKPG